VSGLIHNELKLADGDSRKLTDQPDSSERRSCDRGRIGRGSVDSRGRPVALLRWELWNVCRAVTSDAARIGNGTALLRLLWPSKVPRRPRIQRALRVARLG
jgi:hypothetical protein